MAPQLTRAVLLCRVCELACALPIDAVFETMRPLPVESIAGAPRFVRGISIIRGEPVLVIDAGLLVGQRATAAERVVTLRLGARTIALAVDEVLGVRSLEASTLHELPPLLGPEPAEPIAMIGNLDGQLLLVLGEARLVPDEVLRAIQSEAS